MVLQAVKRIANDLFIRNRWKKRTETLDKNARVYYYGTRYEREFERRKDMVQEEKLKALDANVQIKATRNVGYTLEIVDV